MSEWSSESDEYPGEQFKPASKKPKKPMEAKVAAKDDGHGEEAKVADKDIVLGEKSAQNPLNQVFDNTYHQKIK